MSRKAFTLIELLVVIAIIAILAAILFPVFASAREKARQTACASNLKQMGLAFLQYEQDYDETPPNTTSPWAMGPGWAGQIYPYVKSAGVYICPSDSTNFGANDHDSSYAINTNLLFNPGSSTGNTAWPISKYTSTSMTVLLAEVQGNTGDNVTQYGEYSSPSGYGVGASVGFTNGGWDPNGGGDFGACPGTGLVWATGPLGGRPAAYTDCHFATNPRHTMGSNFLLSDGHVKWLRPTQVSSGNMGGDQTPSSAQDYEYVGRAAGTAGTINGVPVSATFSYL